MHRIYIKTCRLYCKCINIWKYTLRKCYACFTFFLVFKRMIKTKEEASELQMDSRENYAGRPYQNARRDSLEDKSGRWR